MNSIKPGETPPFNKMIWLTVISLVLQIPGMFPKGWSSFSLFFENPNGIQELPTMPIYEFYCQNCHRIFSFYSRSVNTEKRPFCPRCKKVKLERQMSIFALPSQRGEDEDLPLPDMDGGKMEQAMNLLAGEAEHIDENDPRQAARLMRKLTDITGLNLGPGMEEAMTRMEAGEDPEQIEAEMGDLLETEEPFSLREKAFKGQRKRPPTEDKELYDL
jgi:putative FmdB family regulatory protein